MMQQRLRPAAPPDRHHESISNELRRHLSLHRPADHSAREQIDDCRHIAPAFGRPDAGEIGDPFLVRPLGHELAIEDVGCDSRGKAFALILRQAPPARSCPQRLDAHQALDLVQAAGDALGEDIPQTRRAAFPQGATCFSGAFLILNVLI